MALTVEKLEAIRHTPNADAKACLALFAGASEDERQTVAEYAMRWAKANPFDNLAASAALAACSLGQLKKLGWRHVPGDEDAYAVLAARRPPWLAEWAQWILEATPRYFPAVRRLVCEGLCPRPDTENYWLGMLDHSGPTLGRDVSVHDALLADPGLLEEVWHLFEIEGSGEFSLAARDKYCRPEATWEVALVQLAQEGKLSRARLLDASLDALARDFAQFRAGWFSRFHEALQPTLDERAARAERYLPLLASKIPPTVSFALNALNFLDRAGRLPAAAVLTHVGPVLLARHKGTVREALRLLDRAAQTEPASKGAITRLAAEALRHEAAEVQAAALDLIEKHGSHDDETLVQLLCAQAEALAASQRPRLLAWLPGVSAEPSAAPVTETGPLLARAQKLPRALARQTGVDQAVAALKSGSAHVPALALVGADVPRLHADRAIPSITDLDELIDCFAAVLEEPGEPDAVERVLAGVGRLGDQRPDDFARRTGPLTKRAGTLLKRLWVGPFQGIGPLPDLCGLALAWTTGEVPKPAPDRIVRGEPRAVLHFLSRRVHALAERAGKAQAGPLLAAPTHKGGWIDPLALVERVRALPEPADLLDQVQALLRLAPDNRAAALRKSGKLPGELGAALRHALGAKDIEIGPTAALWVAAARARNPSGDDAAVEARHPNLGPDAGTAARLSARRHPKGPYHYWCIEQQPALPKHVPLEFPSVLLHAGVRMVKYFCPVSRWDAAAVRWAGSVWPLGIEAWFAAGVLVIGQNIDWFEAEWGNRAYLEPLLDPDVPLQPMALTLLVLGLAAAEPGESGLATDALIAAIDDGRLDGPTLGTAMGTLLAMGQVKLGRWAKTLAEAARLSPLHAAVVALALQRALQDLPEPPPRDLQALLELLHELLSAAGTGLTLEPTRDALSRQKVAGKTGKLVRALLALPTGSASAQAEAAAARALAGRLERAERWAR
jgi:hypothetical protein